MRHLVCALLLLSASSLAAQPRVAPPAVGLGFGVDTADADVAAVVRLVRVYLASAGDSAAARRLWSTRDPADRRWGDLARFYAYQGFPATIAGVIAAAPGDSVYLVKLLHARADDDGTVDPMALQRLYAVREPDAPHGWRLSNAVGRLTRGWPTRTVGRIAFHYAPGRTHDAERATRAARFVDSTAALFDVPVPERIDYFVTGSPDEYFRAIGLDFFPLPSGRGQASGGNAIVQAGVVLAGDPAQGEAYLHEIAHVILGRRYGGAVVGEGIAAWLGGSRGRAPRELWRLLADYQRAHPDVTLDMLVRGELPDGWGAAESDAMYATGSLFVEHVHRRGGAAALRALDGAQFAGDDAALAAMRTHLGLAAEPDALDAWWRRAAAEAARE
ncbi:MAG TPA: hypothetical protein VFZ11_08635 [Gemmatimonadaceae bacterium]